VCKEIKLLCASPLLRVDFYLTSEKSKDRYRTPHHYRRPDFQLDWWMKEDYSQVQGNYKSIPITPSEDDKVKLFINFCFTCTQKWIIKSTLSFLSKLLGCLNRK